MNNTMDELIHDLSRSFEIVWYSLSIIILIVLLAFLFLSGDIILELSPTCSTKINNEAPCVLCGMTHAFVYISQNNFSIAAKQNSYSIYLFTFFILNSIAFLFSFLKRGKT